MANIPDEPHTNLEQYLNRIATGDGEIPAYPRTNVEEYLNYIIENGTGGGELVTELPEEGKEGRLYILVDNAEHPTKAYGVYTYAGGQYILAAQPVDQSVQMVTELPAEGQEGVLYYLETGEDTYDLYRWINNDWVKVDTDIILYNQEGSNVDGAMTQAATTALKGKAKELTTADYNWPTTGTKTAVNPALLESGLYHYDPASVTLGGMSFGNDYRTFLVSQAGDNQSLVMAFASGVGSTQTGPKLAYCLNGWPQYGTNNFMLSTYDLANNLTTTAQNKPLDARQGKVLNDKIEGRIIQNAGAPTTSTVGTVGKLLEDTTNGKLYICTDATNPYVWEEVGVGGGSGFTELTTADYDWPTDNPTRVALWNLPDGMYWLGSGVNGVTTTSSISDGGYINGGLATAFVWSSNAGYKSYVVFKNNTAMLYKVASTGAIGSALYPVSLITNVAQTTGTSTTDVMSQNATTSMVYADPATKLKVRIGVNSSVSGANATAVGMNSSCTQSDGVAVGGWAQSKSQQAIACGYGSTANAKGSVALGSHSNATTAGEVNIGTSVVAEGYSSSNYRLLTGLYDGQSAHDAATYGQLSTAILNGGTTAPTAATVGAVGTLYSYVDISGTTPAPHLMVCTVVDDTDPQNIVYTWAETGGGGGQTVVPLSDNELNNLWEEES